MKKILALLLSLTMVFLVACSGGDKELATAKIEQGQQTYTIKYYGKDDTITKIDQTLVVKDVTEDQKSQLENGLKEIEEKYKNIKGTTYKGELKDTTFTENIIMNVGNKETLKALIDNNLLNVTDKNAETLELEKTLSTLEASGFTVTRNK